MFKGTIAGTTVVNTNVPVTQILNTNGNTALSDNAVKILSPGYYDIKVMAQVTAGSTGDVTMNVVGENVLTECQNKQTVASGDNYTFTSVDVIKVLQSASNIASISVQFDTAGQVINNGVLIIEKRR